MDREVFTGAIRTFRQRTPFRPFTVITVSGGRYEIDHPEAILERDGVALFAASGGVPVIFDHEGVSEVIGDLANRAAETRTAASNVERREIVVIPNVFSVCFLIALVTTGALFSAEPRKTRTGTVIGELKSISPAKNKRDTIIAVLAPGEEKARRYTIGAQQKNLVAAVNAAMVGDRVEIDWFDTNEGLCVEKFQVQKKKDK